MIHAIERRYRGWRHSANAGAFNAGITISRPLYLHRLVNPVQSAAMHGRAFELIAMHAASQQYGRPVSIG